MRSFNTKLIIISLALVAMIIGGAYVYIRVQFANLSEQYGQEISNESQNNSILINSIYQDEYRLNKRRFSNLTKATLDFSTALALVQVIDTSERLVYDSRFTETSGTQKPSDEIIKTIRKNANKDFDVNTQYCANANEYATSTNPIIDVVVRKITKNPCQKSETHLVEIVYPDIGDDSLAMRYLFTYDTIRSWIFWVGVVTIGAITLVILLFVILYIKVSKPLKKLQKGAVEMAEGNLKYQVDIKSKNEFRMIANFMNEVARNLENVISDLDEKERMVSELDIASKIQNNLLPTSAPDLPGLELVGRTRSSTEVGGDIFNFLEVDENRTLIYIGDVTGHGVPACLLMIMVDVFIHLFAQIYTSVREILVNVNSNLAPRIDTTMFITMLLFDWNVRNQTLTYSSAGHEHIIHYHAATGQCEAIRSGGIALGMVFDISSMAVEKTIQMEDADQIIIYTDGITEAQNSTKELFGLARLQATVEQFGNRSAQGMFDGVTKTLGQFIGEEPQRDDVTMVVMKHKATTIEEIEKRAKKAKLSIAEQKMKREKKAVWDWDKPGSELAHTEKLVTIESAQASTQSKTPKSIMRTITATATADTTPFTTETTPFQPLPANPVTEASMVVPPTETVPSVPDGIVTEVTAALEPMPPVAEAQPLQQVQQALPEQPVASNDDDIPVGGFKISR